MTELYQLGIKALIRNERGEVLLLKVDTRNYSDNKHQNYWDLPGGRVEQGDSIRKTLEREIQEELACSIADEPQDFAFTIANIHIPHGEKQTGLILAIFECSLVPGSSIKLSNEHMDYKWFAPIDAAEKLAVKYAEDFTNKIKQLI